MDGSSGGFGGSRSEFLPGEGYDEPDIKYQRKGGCFVSLRKGVAYIFVSITTVAIVGLLVYFYAPCWKGKKGYGALDDLDTEALISMAYSEPLSNKNYKADRIPKNIIPLFYQLHLQPFLDEDPQKNFTFEGNISINFYVEGPATKTIILHAKDLIISTASVSYVSTSKIEALKSESQVKENDTLSNATESSLNMNVTSESTNEISDSTTRTTSKSPIAGNSSIESISTSTEIILVVATTSSNIPSSTTTTPSSTSSTTEIISSSPTTASHLSTTPATPSDIVTTTKKLIKITKQKHEIEKERYVIKLEHGLEKGINYTVKLEFKGILSQNEKGFLRSSYQDENTGKIRWTAVTNFEPNFARMAFPCFDEPWYKAKFEISIARRTSMMALTNMALKETVPHATQAGWMWDIFETSPPISTYSVAFIISDLVSKKANSTEPGAVANIWGRKSGIQKASYALAIAPKLLNFYNTFFGYHYPLSKIDLVAVPNLPVKSNENWGLIYFREQIAIVQHNSPNYEKELLANHMAYNLGRQWFGGLVTMQAWNESWLMEGLSMYMQYLGMNSIEPSWDILDDFSLTITQEVLDADNTNLIMTNNIELSSIGNEEEIKELVHKKGCSIIRMLNNSLTDSVFIKGLRTYIDAWKYKNAKQGSLWNELTIAGMNSSDLPKDILIKSMIDSWINQEGYPVITITRNYEDDSLIIQQDHFTDINADNKNIWILPLNFITADSTDWHNKTKLWIKQKSTSVTNVIKDGGTKWILFNVQQTSLCRINYDLRNWNLLIKLMQETPKLLSPVNRAQLIDDAFHLARNGLLDYGVAFNLTEYMSEKERHYIPWTALFRNFDYLDMILLKTPDYGQFQDYILKLIKQIYSELGTTSRDNESYATSKLRALIIRWACRINHKPCKDWAFSQFQTWANFTNPDETNPTEEELRATMYCVGVQMRGRSAWDFLWTRFKGSTNTENEAKALITGMGCSKDTWILIRYFQRTLNLSEITNKNSAYVWESLTSDFAIDEAFEFIRENWGTVQNQYKNHHYLTKTIIKGPLSKLSTKNALDEVTKFFFMYKSDLQEFVKYMAQAAKQIKKRLDWKNAYLSTVIKWLQNKTNI